MVQNDVQNFCNISNKAPAARGKRLREQELLREKSGRMLPLNPGRLNRAARLVTKTEQEAPTQGIGPHVSESPKAPLTSRNSCGNMADIMKTLMVGLLLCGIAVAQGKPRVFVETADPASSSATTVSTYFGPSHSEQVRVLSRSCPAIVITEDQAGVKFIVRWESKTWQQTSWSGHQQEFTLYSPNRDVLGSGATHNIANAGKDICKLIASKAGEPSPASSQPNSH